MDLFQKRRKSRRLSTQVQVSFVISYHIVSYIISCYIMSCHIISYNVMSMSCHIMSYHVISYHVTSCHMMLYHIMSYNVMSYHAMSYSVMWCNVMSMSCHNTSYRFKSCHIVSYSCHVMLYHVILLFWLPVICILQVHVLMALRRLSAKSSFQASIPDIVNAMKVKEKKISHKKYYWCKKKSISFGQSFWDAKDLH